MLGVLTLGEAVEGGRLREKGKVFDVFEIWANTTNS